MVIPGNTNYTPQDVFVAVATIHLLIIVNQQFLASCKESYKLLYTRSL